MRITFTTDYTPDGQAPNRPTYKAGETYEFNGPVAGTYGRKYVARGLAVPAVDLPAAVAPEPVEAPQPPVDVPTAEPDPEFGPETEAEHQPGTDDPEPRRKRGRGRH
jgi:hypothetical protein